MTGEFLDYWFEYTKYIPFPRTANTIRSIGNFSLYSHVADPEKHPDNYSFYYRYDGAEKELLEGFTTILEKSKKHTNYYGYSKIAVVNNKDYLYWKNMNFSKNGPPFYCFYKDFIWQLNYDLAHSNSAMRGRFTSPEFTEFTKLLAGESKKFKSIRSVQFKEKFGKTIQEFLNEKEAEKEMQKSIVYSTLVGEAYCSLEKLRDACNDIMNGLQEGRKGYTLDQYTSFRNESMKFNKYLGYNNDFIKSQIKTGGLRRQTLIMFLRDNANRPPKPIKVKK